ncbi:hypothetical protein FJZ31_37750 [Candidatus Poribacteria bacterium]|nr:hypothetical protein [Candidatus Poribacteria bacterium]
MKSSLFTLNLIILSVYVLMGHALAQTHAVDGKYITEWLVLGPFFPDKLDTDYLANVGGEANVQPEEGDTVTTADGKPLTWKRYKSTQDIIDLLDAVGYYENSIAYAFCVLRPEVAGDFQIGVASDDGVAVWINGKQVDYKPGIRGFSFDQDVIDVNLKADANRCLVKMSFGSGPWCFAVRVFPPERAGISGIITDEKGKPIPNATIRLEQGSSPPPNLPRQGGGNIAQNQGGESIMQTQTDASGSYRLGVYPVRGPYDLSVTSGELGDWQLDIRLREGERRTLNRTLKNAISIEGTLLMLDDKTPHVAVPVQVVGTPLSHLLPPPLAGEGRGGGERGTRVEGELQVIAGTLSDEVGKYRFINLKPGSYQVRCQVLGGYIYYSENPPKSPFSKGGLSKSLQVERGKSLKNIDFRFAAFKKGTWKNYDTANGLAANAVSAIYRDPDGMMWFGTQGGGVSRYDGREFVNLTTKDGLVDDWVNVIYRDPNGIMWFATGNPNIGRGGVSRYDGKKFVNFTTKDGLANDIVYTIHRDPDGVMWFGTNNGVSRYDGKKFVNLTGLENKGVNAIYRTPDDVMWFGCTVGVYRYDGKTFANFTTRDGLLNNWVHATYRAPNGVMWFGTDDGVSLYDRSKFVKLNGLENNSVIAIHRAPNGVMWFGTWYKGTYRYDGRDFIKLNELGDKFIATIYHDSDDVMWFGTWGNGVYRYDGKKLDNFTTKEGLANNIVLAIDSDLDGMMWFGTLAGVSRYDGKRFLDFTTKGGPENNKVFHVYRDPDGTIWFATWGGGVYRYDGKKFVNFTTKDGLAHNLALTIYRDSNGNMWFGTDGGGVSCYDGTAWISLDMRDGLMGNSVGTILQDSDGSFWFRSDKGMTRYRRSNVPPKVHIVSVTTDKTYSDLSAIPAFTHGTRVTIAYDAIDFKTVPEKRQYRCRIIEIPPNPPFSKGGTDSDWRKPTKSASFDYTFDKPGKYTFEVQAIDRDLNYSEPASLSIVISAPPFYQTGIFLLALSITGGMLLVGIIILGVQRWRLSNAEKLRLRQELSDAHQMQLRLLPESAPTVEGFDIAGSSKPAREVGGDFFDYLSLTDGKIGIALADVSGKGLKGAMNAVLANGMLHEVAKTEASCGKILSALNADLCPRLEKGMFTALGLAIFDQNGKTLQWASAAQPHPLVKRDEEVFEFKSDGAFPLGMMRNVAYPDFEQELQEGDIVIFYTDGIIEAENEAEEMYGAERLEKVVTHIVPTMTAEGIIETILQDVADFVGAAEQYDDMTVVVVKKVLN